MMEIRLIFCHGGFVFALTGSLLSHRAAEIKGPAGVLSFNRDEFVHECIKI